MLVSGVGGSGGVCVRGSHVLVKKRSHFSSTCHVNQIQQQQTELHPVVMSKGRAISMTPGDKLQESKASSVGPRVAWLDTKAIALAFGV